MKDSDDCADRRYNLHDKILVDDPEAIPTQLLIDKVKVWYTTPVTDCISLSRSYPFSTREFVDAFIWLDDWLTGKKLKASMEFRLFIVQFGAEYALAMLVDLPHGVREQVLFQENQGRLKPWIKLLGKKS